jgi:hypothetical protein
MKRIILLCLVTVSLTSCLKIANRELGVYNIADGYIAYQVNGYPFEINGGYNSFANTGTGVYCTKQLKSVDVPTTRYILTGQLTQKKTIQLVIETDSLVSGSYNASVGTGMTLAKIDTVEYSGIRAEDVLTVNITRNATGILEGAFSGKLSFIKNDNHASAFEEGVITNGVFKNVSIRY